MPDLNRPPTPVVSRRPTAGSGALYVMIGALVVAVLVGGYVMFGMPGLHTQVAHMPGQNTPSQNIDVTVQQSAAPAPDK
jgi:hypothetical protein